MCNLLCDYVEALFRATSFDEGFAVFQNEIFRLGYGGVLYTYIPQAMIQTNFGIKPVYHVSEGYCPGYLDHYAEARFDKVDPLINAVKDGVTDVIDWRGAICEHYMQGADPSREVIEVSRSYGIKNGLTIPLMSGPKGIAGASLISYDSAGSIEKNSATLQAIKVRTTLFHKMVVSNSCCMSEFIRPILASFSSKQLRYVAGLASGKTTAELAEELRTTPGYLEQTMLKLRRKLSGVDEFDAPTISRNQVLYYAGLLNLLENDLLVRPT